MKMSQVSTQEVPSTPQIELVLFQHEERFNQRVPSQEFHSQNDENAMVPGTPMIHRTHISTPLTERLSNPNAFLFDHFRTPGRINASESSPAAQVVPGTPKGQNVSAEIGVQSPLIRSSRSSTSLTTPSNYSIFDSPFQQPEPVTTPKLGQWKCKNVERSFISNCTYLHKQCLLRKQGRLINEDSVWAKNEALSKDTHCDATENKDMISESCSRAKRLDCNGDETLQLLQDVAHRLQDGKNPNIAVNTSRRRQKRHIRHAEATAEDFLDIIDETEAS